MLALRYSCIALVGISLASCQAQTSGPPAEAPLDEATRAQLPDRPNGSNLILRTDLEQADTLELIVSDVVIPPGAQVPRHTHPGEEFV